MTESSDIYTLPVVENGKTGLYHCILEFCYPTLQEGKIFNWFLLKEDKLLSSGICAEDDVAIMLNALKIDLNGYRDWFRETVH